MYDPYGRCLSDRHRQRQIPDQCTADVPFCGDRHTDYTDEEKKIIFSKYALPKVLKRMSLKENEIILTDEGLDRIIQKHANTSGIRDLEQAAEHIAANALYQIEVNHMQSVTIDAQMVEKVLE